MKRVSIVIPVLNGANYIAQAIESVLSQSYPRISLTVCNGGSTDATEEIAKSYGIEVVPGEFGLLQNWRAALKVADGDYVKLLCHDDTLREDCIERQVAALDNDLSLSFVSCCRQYIDASSEKRGTQILQAEDKKIPGKYAAQLLLNYGNLFGETSCALWRNTKIEFPDSMNWLLDIHMWTQLCGKGDYLYISDLLANIRKHDEQDTHRVLRDPDYHAKENADWDEIRKLNERLFP